MSETVTQSPKRDRSVRPANSRVQHGDPSCADYGCRRAECLEARRFKQKQNKFLRQTGRPGYVAPEKAAAHIQRFRAVGLQDKEIIPLIGTGRNTFYRIQRGMPIMRTTEQRILASPVPAGSGTVRALAGVPAVGVHRRIQALMRMGWPAGVLEQRLHVAQGWVARSVNSKDRVTMAVQHRVIALYDELWNVKPESAGVDEAWACQVRGIAASAGYVGPLAWDDATIDDPHAVPQTDADEPIVSQGGNLADRWLMGEAVVLDQEARLQVLAHLYEWTSLSRQEIADRLEMNPRAADRAWHRLRSKAREEGRPVPWRRVWVAPVREMKQQEMGAAA